MVANFFDAPVTSGCDIPGSISGIAVAPARHGMDIQRYLRERGGFADRRQAGVVLAEHLRRRGDMNDSVVLALPRGGVPVGYEVARELRAPLDVFVVRKLGLPGHQEFAMGAIASGGVRVLNDDVVGRYPVSAAALDAVTRTELHELQRRERVYRDGRPLLSIEGRVVILVDDGLATGSTMRAAVLAVRRLNPARVVVAVPVGARESCQAFRPIVDDIVCAFMPDTFRAVGLWYSDFSETSDDEVRQLLAARSREIAAEVIARSA